MATEKKRNNVNYTVQDKRYFKKLTPKQQEDLTSLAANFKGYKKAFTEFENIFEKNDFKNNETEIWLSKKALGAIYYARGAVKGKNGKTKRRRSIERGILAYCKNNNYIHVDKYSPGMKFQSHNLIEKQEQSVARKRKANHEPKNNPETREPQINDQVAYLHLTPKTQGHFNFFKQNSIQNHIGFNTKNKTNQTQTDINEFSLLLGLNPQEDLLDYSANEQFGYGVLADLYTVFSFGDGGSSDDKVTFSANN